MSNLNNGDVEAAAPPGSSWRTYTLGGKETVATVVRKFGVSEWRLRRFNGLSPTARIGPGTTLLVPEEEAELAGLPGSSAEEAPKLGVDKPRYKRVKRNGKWVTVPITSNAKKPVKAAPAGKALKAKPAPPRKVATPAKKPAAGKK